MRNHDVLSGTARAQQGQDARMCAACVHIHFILKEEYLWIGLDVGLVLLEVIGDEGHSHSLDLRSKDALRM